MDIEQTRAFQLGQSYAFNRVVIEVLGRLRCGEEPTNLADLLRDLATKELHSLVEADAPNLFLGVDLDQFNEGVGETGWTLACIPRLR